MSYWGSFWWTKVDLVLSEGGFTEDEKKVVYKWYRFEEEYGGELSTESLFDLVKTYSPDSVKDDVLDIMYRFTKQYDKMFKE